MPGRAFALAAHPDDIEFQMAGTLILLRRAGYEIHYMNIANGSCGTTEYGKAEIIAMRRAEAQAAAASIGAVFHESLVDDLAIFYEPGLLARVAAVMREVAPEILLLQSPQDYMEDHQNAVRLGVTAAFAREMPNFSTDPPRRTVAQPVTVYHAQPHGNRDPLRQPVRPELFIDIAEVLAEKRAMLALHTSQKTWLDRSPGHGRLPDRDGGEQHGGRGAVGEIQVRRRLAEKAALRFLRRNSRPAGRCAASVHPIPLEFIHFLILLC